MAQPAVFTNEFHIGVSYSFVFKLKVDPRYRKGMTLSQISHEIVKPDTLTQSKCPFYKLFEGDSDEKGMPFFSKPTAFLSYARQYSLDIILSVLEQNRDQHPYVWFDLFVLSQHDKEKDFGAAFQSAIVDIGKANGTVLLVMSPWNNALFLARAW